MEPALKAYDLDLSLMASEALAVLAKECGYKPAWDELLSRQETWKQRMIARQASACGLPFADREDAQQQAWFAMREAIASYDTAQFRCGFRTHSERVLTARFWDFLKSRRRYERGLDRSRTSATGIAEGRGRRSPRADGNSVKGPAMLAEEREAMQRLQRAVNELDAEQTFVWLRLAAGTSRPAIAKELGMSPDKVKRCCRKLLSLLAAKLRDV